MHYLSLAADYSYHISLLSLCLLSYGCYSITLNYTIYLWLGYLSPVVSCPVGQPNAPYLRFPGQAQGGGQPGVDSPMGEICSKICCGI